MIFHHAQVFPIRNYFKSFSSLVNSVWTIVPLFVTAFLPGYFPLCPSSMLHWDEGFQSIDLSLPTSSLAGQRSRSKCIDMSWKDQRTALPSLFFQPCPLQFRTNKQNLPLLLEHAVDCGIFCKAVFLWQECPFSLLLPGQIAHLSFKTLLKCHYSLELLPTELAAIQTLPKYHCGCSVEALISCYKREMTAKSSSSWENTVF